MPKNQKTSQKTKMFDIGLFEKSEIEPIDKFYHALTGREFLDYAELVLFKDEAKWSPRDRRRYREIQAKLFATNECFRGLRNPFEDQAE